MPLLEPDLKARLLASERIEVGRYYPFRGDIQQDFVIQLDSAPLAALIEAAFMGARVYEFMSIKRPGDLLHYLWVIPAAVSVEVGQCIDQVFVPFDSNRPRPSLEGLPFPDFDRCFRFDGDDTEPMAGVWLDFRHGNVIGEKLLQLLAVVEPLQCQLRDRDEFLLQFEIDLMDSKCHRRDFDAEIPRWTIRNNPYSEETSLPPDLYRLICELISRDDVQSVSCPFDDYALWRALVTEQIQRSIRTGQTPKEAFELSGPDSGLPLIPYLEWGGDVHIPYEGMCDGDLLIPPDWRKLDASRGMGPEGRLSRVLGKNCHYLLTDRDLGEMDCADRASVGAWFLYRSKIPGP